MLPDASTLTPPQEGQAPPTSTDTRTADQLLEDAASGSTSSPTGAAGNTDKPASTNLHDDPNFRKLQSQYEKRLAEQAKRLAELEAQQEEATLADMDDVDRLRYTNEKLSRQLQEREQAEAVQRQKQTILGELSAKSGVPIEVLSEADSAYDAALIAVDYLRRDEKKEASKVDLGGGRASTPSDRAETAFREAFANRDATAYIRLIREAQG